MTERVGFREWYMLAIVTAAYVLSNVDRSVLALVAGPIKADLGITDLQMSLLIGFAFVVLFSVLSIPAGYLIDLYSRRKIMSGAVFFWSLMSTVCGFAGSYGMLFAGRTGLGIGEAALAPAAYSMIQGGFPPERRSRAFAIFHIAPSIGRGLALVAGGTLFTLAEAGGLSHIPILGALRPWQVAIAVPALCGLPLALLILTVREPPRIRTSGEGDASFAELFRYMRLHWRLYAPIIAANTCMLLGSSGFTGWMPTALSRNWGLKTGTIGHTLGSIELIAAPLGLLVIATVMQRAARKNRQDIIILISAGSLIIAEICNLSALLMPTLPLAWTALSIAAFNAHSYSIVSGVVLAGITPGRLFGKSTAVFFLVQTLLGNSFGPTVVVLVSNALFTGPRALSNGMMLTYGVVTTTAIILFFVLSRSIRVWDKAASVATA